jgi:3-dehydroquinate synthase
MEHLQQSFTVTYKYNVYFTSALFNVSNKLLNDYLTNLGNDGLVKRIFFVIDRGVLDAHPALLQDVKKYFSIHHPVQLIEEILVVPGGETVKNSETYFRQLINAVNTYGIDRHSYIAAIGGGSVLDMVGYAAAVAHRGIKHIRIPTTVLSQNDSGVGVKNSINYFGKKNFIGTFAPPLAVFNDEQFLVTLSDRDWRSGISEAIKVALIKDAPFFDWLENNATALTAHDSGVMKQLIWRCADLHLQHIASGDPFEFGSSRPLDFGHWSAHKLEQLTNFDIRHGEAVAMGIALDTVYSHISGRLPFDECERVIQLLKKLGFDLTHPLMEVLKADSPILQGLEEFREHLGGRLTIMLLDAIGKGIEVHEIDTGFLVQSGMMLKKLESKNAKVKIQVDDSL